MDSKITSKLAGAEKILGYTFKNKDLLLQSLTHASFTQGEGKDNERLEFFGDAILNVITSEILYYQFPEKSEGDLTLIKSFVVSRSTLARVLRSMELREFCFLGKGIAQSKTLPDSVLANFYEAVLAGIYIDGGVEPAKTFVKSTLDAEIDNVLKKNHKYNYKSFLQDLTLKLYGVNPEYKVVEETGPDHGKNFRVITIVNGNTYGEGWGKNKKEAQQNAAKVTLENFTQNLADKEQSENITNDEE